MDLFHLREGAGEPLLLVQGMSGTHASWGAPFLAALHQHGFETVRYDHRGIGRSPHAAPGFSIADLADDAAGLLDALGWERAHVMGISMGGMVAQELALRHGERVRTLTLGCTTAGGPRAAPLGGPAIARLAAAIMSGDAERVFRAGWDANLSAAFRAVEGNYAAFRAMATAERAPVAVMLGQRDAIAGHDTSSRLAALDVPALVIHGDEDAIIDVANGRLIADLLVGARLEVLAGVGHLFYWERPAEVAAMVSELARSRPA